MTQLQKWQLLQSHFVIQNPWCCVRQDAVKLPNGTIVEDFFVHVRPDIALVVAVTTQREVVTVRQYRHGIQEILQELPAGSFDPQQEDALIAAQRELEEETGYSAPHWQKLGIVYDNPVKDTNKIHLFLARNAQKTSPQTLDPTEQICVELLPIEHMETAIAQGQIQVAGSLTALFLARPFLLLL